MARTNGKAEKAPTTPDGLRAQLAGLQARLRELQAGRETVAAEAETLTADRPALAARVHVHGEAAARPELAQLNARALELEAATAGYDSELARVRDQIAGVEAAAKAAVIEMRLREAEACDKAAVLDREAAMRLALQKVDEMKAALEAV